MERENVVYLPTGETMADSVPTIRFGVTGVSGFSERHLEWVERAGAAGGPVKLEAVALIVENEATRAVARKLRERGVIVVVGYDELLGLHGAVDVVTLPVGIHLHEPLAVKALHAGYSVYLEKPVAGSVGEIASLSEAQENAAGRLLIGFQTMYQPALWELKRRLVSGLIGRIGKVVITLPWGRPESYFSRNAWAGKIRFNGAMLYDSPMSNAGGHFLNTGFFLAGRTVRESAVPVGVEAELYRANAIESADNCFARFHTDNGVEVVYLASLSCRGQSDPTIDIIGDAGRVVVTDKPERMIAPWTEIDAGGNSREVGGDIACPEPFACVARAVADPEYGQVSTLKTGCLVTVANQMAFVASPIVDLPLFALSEMVVGGKRGVHVVDGDGVLQELRAECALPNETGRYPWSVPAGHLPEREARSLLEQTGIDFL